MRKLCYLASLFLLSSLFVCCSNIYVYESEIDVSFSDSIHDSVFQMSQLYEEKYDSFYVLRPYFNGGELFNQLELSDGLKELCVGRLKDSDDVFIILLSKNDTVKVYSVIGRNDVVYFKLPYCKGIYMDAPLSFVSDSIHTVNFVKFMEE